jgi:transposase-like protein
MLEGTIEVDETYVGGKEANKHQSYRARKARGQALGGRSKEKAMVAGAIERGGKVVTKVLPNAKGKNVLPFLTTHIAKGSIMVSDDFKVYRNLPRLGYSHEYVNHSANEYVRDGFHTNTIEGYWSILKRGIYGIYHQTSKKHLHRYCSEFAFRYNTRKLKESDRFHIAVKQLENTRLRYFELIDKRDTRRKLDIDPNYDGIWV